MTMERRLREVEMLRKRYSRVEHGPNLDWLMFKEFPLPAGWDRESTDILVLIPPGYPETPPDNFYVPNGLRLQSNTVPGNFAEGQEILGAAWAQFSYHAETWTPTHDLWNGDTLVTFMAAVERRLREAN